MLKTRIDIMWKYCVLVEFVKDGKPDSMCTGLIYDVVRRSNDVYILLNYHSIASLEEEHDYRMRINQVKKHKVSLSSSRQD